MEEEKRNAILSINLMYILKFRILQDSFIELLSNQSMDFNWNKIHRIS